MFSRFDPRRFSAILSLICVGSFIFQNKIANIETRKIIHCFGLPLGHGPLGGPLDWEGGVVLFWFAPGPWPPGLEGGGFPTSAETLCD